MKRVILLVVGGLFLASLYLAGSTYAINWVFRSLAYSNPTTPCYSIRESKKKNLFVSKLRLPPDEFELAGHRVRVKEAWLERLTKAPTAGAFNLCITAHDTEPLIYHEEGADFWLEDGVSSFSALIANGEIVVWWYTLTEPDVVGRRIFLGNQKSERAIVIANGD